MSTTTVQNGKGSRPRKVDLNTYRSNYDSIFGKKGSENVMTKKLDGRVFGIDFDGSAVAHEFPAIGRDIGAVPVLKRMAEEGAQLILFTMRSGETLQDAVDWFAHNDIPLYGINRNPDQDSWTSSPKAYAHIYIDDAALGCPLVHPTGERSYVDWTAVSQILGL